MMDLSKFNENQKEAITFVNGICMVIASAGSGKTSVITNRIKYLVEECNINLANILAVTFTYKSGEEMKERLSSIGINGVDNIGTFHKICYRMIREQGYVSPSTKILSDDKAWMKKKILDNITRNKSDIKYSTILGFISCQKNHLITCDNDEMIEYGRPYEFDELKELYRTYEYHKKMENVIDFDDMILLCYQMLYSDKSILQHYQNQYKYIMVDEFQDTNKAQYELLKLLSNSNHNLFVVGDDAQSIYGFRQADVGIMLHFKNDFATCKEIQLKTNYRSTKQIVDMSNKLINKNKNQFKKACFSNSGIGKEITFNCFTNEYKEAEFIANSIIENKYNYDNIAVLYRTNAQSQAIENIFAKFNIPCEGSGRTFFENKEIMDIINYLRVFQNHNNDTALLKIINTPNRYLGKIFIEKAKKYANNHNISIYETLIHGDFLLQKSYWFDNAYKLYSYIDRTNTNLKPKNLIEHIVDGLHYENYLYKTIGDDIEERLENIDKFIGLAGQYKTLDEFLQYIDEFEKQSEKINNTTNKVKLMTIHRSKGLEFPIVFFIGVNETVIPHAKANNIEEERRMAYVAISRPKDKLYVSWNQSYNNRAVMASRFIKDMIGKKKLTEIENNMI